MTMTRYGEPPLGAAQTTPDWRLDQVVPPSTLFGANGMRLGPDGRLYVTQAFGSQISALDLDTGASETISAPDGPIVAPDDVAFDSSGAMYVTEVMSARVSARMPDGKVRVIADNVPAANGITVHQDRIFMDEFRPGGRLFELYPDGRAPRVIGEDLPLPNALSMGPDGWIYFPAVPAGEIWRIPVEGGAPERALSGLDRPTAVKFDQNGFLVTTQAGNGEITRIDIRSGAATTLGRVRRGIDNLAFGPDGRLFISHFVDGGVAEIMPDGKERVLVAPAFVGPMGLAVGDNGTIYVADGLSIAALTGDGQCTRPGMLLDHSFPGFVRGIAAGENGGVYVCNTAGQVVAFWPDREAEIRAEGLDQPFGMARAADGAVLVASSGDGRVVRVSTNGTTVLARGLGRPTGVAAAPDGGCYVGDAAGGRVVHIDRSGTITTALDGLQEPHGVALSGDDLFVLDRAGKSLHLLPLSGGPQRTVVQGLPVGSKPGLTPKPLPGLGMLLPGPIEPFAGLAAGPDGTIYIAADGEGSLLALRRAQSARA